MRCPQCQEPLTPPLAGRRASCSLCGWVEPPPKDDEPLARKAEEIARQRQLDTEPVWRYLVLGLTGLSLLVIGFNNVVGSFERAKATKEQLLLEQRQEALRQERQSPLSGNPAGIPAGDTGNPALNPAGGSSGSPPGSGTGLSAASPSPTPFPGPTPLDAGGPSAISSALETIEAGAPQASPGSATSPDPQAGVVSPPPLTGTTGTTQPGEPFPGGSPGPSPAGFASATPSP